MATTIVTEEEHANQAPLVYSPMGAMLARNAINEIAMVLANHWEQLSPVGASQLVERAVEHCRPFVPAEVRGQIDIILDYNARVQGKRWRGGQA